MTCDGIRTVFPIRLRSTVHTPSSDTIPGTKPTTRTRRLPSQQGNVRGRHTCDGVTCYSSVSFAGKRFAQPAYGVPSGPFSSTCQNDTSSGNTQRKSLGANCKHSCCSLSWCKWMLCADLPSHGHTSIAGCGFLEYDWTCAHVDDHDVDY